MTPKPNNPLDAIAPDMECSLWPDGIPTWLGGTGNEWINCCQTHDHAPQNLQSAIDLGVCVANQGYAGMGVLMTLGVAVLGPAYLAIKRLTTRRKSS